MDTLVPVRVALVIFPCFYNFFTVIYDMYIFFLIKIGGTLLL